jgi:hypothetical protein
MEAIGMNATLLSSSIPAVPPTMTSNAPPPQPRAIVTPAPQYVITPAKPPVQQLPTLPSAQGLTPYAPPPPTPSPYVMPPPQAMMGPQYYMMQPQQQQQGTPGLAVASLVCGLLGWIPLWIGFILCLLAITFAVIVLSQTKPGQNGRGLAIAGLVCGLLLFLPAACGL